MIVSDFFCVLVAFPIVLGLCSFPSEIVGKQYEYFDGSATTKFTDTQQLIEIKLQATTLVTPFSCEKNNGDFFIIRGKDALYCLKFTSTNSSTPQGYAIGMSNDVFGSPSLCDLCVGKHPPEEFQLSEYNSGEPYPSLLPFGCNIPPPCPVRNEDDILCTSKPVVTD